MKTLLTIALAVQIANPCLTCPSVGVAGDVETNSAVGAITPCTATHHGAHRGECPATTSAIMAKSSLTTERSNADIGPTVSVSTAVDDIGDRLRIGLPGSSVPSGTRLNLFTVLRI